jgi:endo-1,4-beta-xylanase
MHLPSSLLLLAASLPLGMAGKGNGKNCKGLDVLAKKAGLKYFGAATDSPGQRERAGYEAKYPQYDQIMWDSGEFGQTTPTNGQKVGCPTSSARFPR